VGGYNSPPLGGGPKMCSSNLHPPRGHFEANRCSSWCHRHPAVCEKNCRLDPRQHTGKEEAPFSASSSSPRIRTSNLAVRGSSPERGNFGDGVFTFTILRLIIFFLALYIEKFYIVIDQAVSTSPRTFPSLPATTATMVVSAWI
jgi:hypothetical protein